jgi:SAM-dependent methyltransferase
MPNSVSRGALARLISRYHRGGIALADAEIERHLFGLGPAADEPLGPALVRLGIHKLEEGPARYDVIRTALSLLPHRDVSLLDIGSGSGRLLLYAALTGVKHAQGIEILEPRAALARAAAVRLGLHQVTVTTGDALRAPWPEAEVLVLMNPFYPSAYPGIRRRLLEHGARPLILCGATILERLARDRSFRVLDRARLEWMRFGLLEVR